MFAVLDLLLAALPLDKLVGTILGLIWKDSPSWLGELGGALVVSTKALVEELTDKGYAELPGREKLEAVVREVESLLDEAFDDVPEWSELSERRRDSIISGWAETVLFIHEVTAAGGKGRKTDVKRSLRKIRKLSKKRKH